jgi:hypothetical protein
MKPGQQRAMNMVFERTEKPQAICPACSAENKGSENAETIW